MVCAFRYNFFPLSVGRVQFSNVDMCCFVTHNKKLAICDNSYESIVRIQSEIRIRCNRSDTHFSYVSIANIMCVEMLCIRLKYLRKIDVDVKRSMRWHNIWRCFLLPAHYINRHKKCLCVSA